MANGKALATGGALSILSGSILAQAAASATFSESSQEAAEAERDAAMHKLLQHVVDDLRRLAPGGSLIVPSFHPVKIESSALFMMPDLSQLPLIFQADENIANTAASAVLPGQAAQVRILITIKKSN